MGLVLPFKILGIEHCGLAPKDPVKARSFFEQTLGLRGLGEELVAEQKVLTIMMESAHGLDTQGPRLEILDTQGDTTGPVAKFLQTRGSGVHHIALRVDNLDAALEYLKLKQIELIDSTPRNGSHSTKIAFIHPKATGGLLIELVEQVG